MILRRLPILVAVTALVVGAGTAHATPGAVGVHGSSTLNRPNWRLSVNANRVPSGNLVGGIHLTVLTGSPSESWVLDARPRQLTVSGNSACVVAEVTRWSKFPYTPVLITVNIVDVQGGPDLFSVDIALSDQPGVDWCSLNPAAIPNLAGNFTIIGST